MVVDTPIRTLRVRLQLSTAGVALLVGCTQRQVQRWERAEQSPPPAVLRLLRLAETVPGVLEELQRMSE